MGCDIHLKLEMKRVGDAYLSRTNVTEDGAKKELVTIPLTEYTRNWRSVRFTRDDCWGDRVYGMFAKLADVRNYYEEKFTPIPQRGFPEDACDDTKNAYSFIVISDDAYNKDIDYYENSRWYHYINESTANKWLKEGISVEMEPFGNTEFKKITGPDWHSPNWCTTQEMEDCIKDVFWDEENQVWVGDYIEWFALLGAMKGIEQNGVYECRAVFWFDN